MGQIKGPTRVPQIKPVSLSFRYLPNIILSNQPLHRMKFSIATTFALFAAVAIATPIAEEKRWGEQLE
ncbi:hypothetical protein L218DRAFT_964967 [Marasmius fiardii PR-910]|nr:hypothetical protein L218DRAFT_964967 [Marasmius fiardii PR-910]